MDSNIFLSRRAASAAGVSVAVFLFAVSFLAVLCVGLTSCGGGGGFVSPPPPTITSVTVSPSTAMLETGQTQQFTATVQGTGSFSRTVNWFVNDVSGGSATVGTITSAGLYTAPASVPSPATVTVKAVSAADASRSGTASVTVKAPPPPNITWSPSSVETILSPGESDAVDVTFKSDRSFQNAVIEATGDIAQFVTLTPGSIAKVAAGQHQAVRISFSIPAGSELATVSGAVQVNNEGQGLSDAISVEAEIWGSLTSDGVSFKYPPEWTTQVLAKVGDSVPVMAVTSPSGSDLVVLREGGSAHDFGPAITPTDVPLVLDSHTAVRTDYTGANGIVYLVRVVFSPPRPEAPAFELEFRPNSMDPNAEAGLEGVLQTLQLR